FPAPPPRIVAPMPAVDDYFNSLDASARDAFEHICDLVIEIVPEAEQGTSYGMATLKYNQKPLLAFLAAKHHLSIFPFSSRVVDAGGDRAAGFERSQGNIRVPLPPPPPAPGPRSPRAPPAELPPHIPPMPLHGQRGHRRDQRVPPCLPVRVRHLRPPEFCRTACAARPKAVRRDVGRWHVLR